MHTKTIICLLFGLTCVFVSWQTWQQTQKITQLQQQEQTQAVTSDDEKEPLKFEFSVEEPEYIFQVEAMSENWHDISFAKQYRVILHCDEYLVLVCLDLNLPTLFIHLPPNLEKDTLFKSDENTMTILTPSDAKDHITLEETMSNQFEVRNN